MTAQEKDLIVLGSGPGGYVAAIRAAQLGRKVSIIEKEALGGVCLNWGCIPTKALIQSARAYGEIKRAHEFGLENAAAQVNFPKIVDRSRQIAAKLSGGVSFLMRKNKIEVISGHGTLLSGRRIAVRDAKGQTTEYRFADIIIASGARPKVPPGMEIDGNLIHTSRTILEQRRLPQKLLVIGAGAIGIEFAYIFNALGVEVTVAEMLERILPVEDHEVSDALGKIFSRRGMQIKTGCTVNNLRAANGKVSAVLKNAQGEEAWQGDCALVAVGVAGNVEDIGLEQAGIKLERGFIAADQHMRTNVPHHYAIGDAAGPPWLAHVASHEGITAAEHCCGKEAAAMHYENIPACTYCIPQAASVGLTEKQAREKGLNFKIGKMPFSASGKAIAAGETEGFVKTIVESETGEVLGVHILHAEATELISEAAIIRSHEGVAASVIDTIHPHPTLSEGLMEAMAAALGRPINT